jgi:hypothetical protein
MVAMMAHASKYNWSDWMVGIMRSFLSGGAVALTTGTGGAILGIPGKQVWILMGVNFILLGLYRMGEFLSIHGAPDPVALQVALDKAQVATKEAGAAVAEAKAAAPTPDPPKG